MVLYIGLLKSIILTLVINTIQAFLMKQLFGLELLASSDLNFVDWEPEKQYNMNFNWIFEGKCKEEIKKIFIERAMKFFKRLRQKMVYKYFNFYWEEYPLEEAIKQISFIEEDIKNEDDSTKFLERLMCNPFDVNQFQFKIFIGENSNNQTYFIMQNDHSMADGFGLLCLISKLTDGFDMKKFPPSKGKSFFTKLKQKILSPFVSIFALYYLYGKLSGKTPFRVFKEYSIHKKGHATKKFDFNILQKMYKKLDVTFNDFMLGAISAASKKYCTDLGYNKVKHLNVIVPVNLRNPPQTEEDLKMTNESSCSSIPLELIDNIPRDISRIKKKNDFLLRNHVYPESINFLNMLSNIFLPFNMSRLLIKKSVQNYDFVISNVPGPVEHMYMGGFKITDVFCLPNPGPHSCFIAIFCYLNKARLFIMNNSSAEMDPQEFAKYIEREIDKTQEDLNIKTN